MKLEVGMYVRTNDGYLENEIKSIATKEQQTMLIDYLKKEDN